MSQMSVESSFPFVPFMHANKIIGIPDHEGDQKRSQWEAMGTYSWLKRHSIPCTLYRGKETCLSSQQKKILAPTGEVDGQVRPVASDSDRYFHSKFLRTRNIIKLLCRKWSPGKQVYGIVMRSWYSLGTLSKSLSSFGSDGVDGPAGMAEQSQWAWQSHYSCE